MQRLGMADAVTYQNQASGAAPIIGGHIPFFDAELHPNRPLSPKGTYIVLGILAGFSLIISIGFLAVGAWPVPGFLGLDLIILYVAFRIARKRAHKAEAIRLDDRELTVTRFIPGKPPLVWRLEPAWVKVGLEPIGRQDNRLTLRDRNYGLNIGSFLLPEEREDIADALKAALHKRLRSLPHL